MYVMSYVVLFRLCLPFNKYKIILFSTLLVLGVICLLVNEYVDGVNFLGFKLIELSNISVKLCIILLLSGIVFYTIINVIIHVYEKYHEAHRKKVLKILQTRKYEDEEDEC